MEIKGNKLELRDKKTYDDEYIIISPDNYYRFFYDYRGDFFVVESNTTIVDISIIPRRHQWWYPPDTLALLIHDSDTSDFMDRFFASGEEEYLNLEKIKALQKTGSMVNRFYTPDDDQYYIMTEILDTFEEKSLMSNMMTSFLLEKIIPELGVRKIIQNYKSAIEESHYPRFKII